MIRVRSAGLESRKAIVRSTSFELHVMQGTRVFKIFIEKMEAGKQRIRKHEERVKTLAALTALRPVSPLDSILAETRGVGILTGIRYKPVICQGSITSSVWQRVKAGRNTDLASWSWNWFVATMPISTKVSVSVRHAN